MMVPVMRRETQMQMPQSLRGWGINEKAPVSGGFQDQSEKFSYWK